jgi:hypothetical protein
VPRAVLYGAAISRITYKPSPRPGALTGNLRPRLEINALICGALCLLLLGFRRFALDQAAQVGNLPKMLMYQLANSALGVWT